MDPLSVDLKLQQACSNCRKKKRKCDSIKPSCSRCLSLDQPCSYAPARKRGPKPQQKGRSQVLKFSTSEKEVLGNLLLAPEFSFHTLNPHIQSKESLSWNILQYFAYHVSKNFGTLSFIPCNDFTLFFYAGMIYQIGNILQYRVQKDGTFNHAVNQFNKIITDKGLNFTGLSKTLLSQFNRGIKNSTDSVHEPITQVPFFINGQQMYCSFKETIERKKTKQKLNVEIKCEVNKNFEKVFGYSNGYLNFALEQSVNGVLPFGSSSEDALMKYIEVFALEMKHIKLDDETLSLPIQMNLCNSVILDLQTIHGLKKFQVFVLINEHGSFENYISENQIYFIPLFKTVQLE
eukprot:snap_masked-scaffold_50-processed-gene-1.76-mRNA-1 protein AED:1.00 eAED:1.00 QI:0/0/0/0/1/1/2/0/346